MLLARDDTFPKMAASEKPTVATNKHFATVAQLLFTAASCAALVKKMMQMHH